MSMDMAPNRKLDRKDVNRFLRQKGLVALADKSNAAHLQCFALTPDVVFDIGVDSGTPFLYQAFPEAHFVLIDPRAESEKTLSTPDAPAKASFHQLALGAEAGEMTLNIPYSDKGEQGAMASLRQRQGYLADKIEWVETRQVAVDRLDSIAAAYPGRVGLKVDTEGFEDEVLAGAPETLARCDFVILEMSLTQRFDTTTPPSQIIARLAAAGLEFRDVLRMTGDGRGGPAPRLMDILFTRWAADAPAPLNHA
ncbi:FkbM family methyltransferase [Pseudorhodobacter sp. E13]|uniref:FkbM family methyltransferase n=1 Tax=Pseudorhodobacter sp. E13 TaxID=2487931 RepID=UPI001F01CF48|nr:FkbM family methyltransferase [Pseudorhodobacter sp. E13]